MRHVIDRLDKSDMPTGNAWTSDNLRCFPGVWILRNATTASDIEGGAGATKQDIMHQHKRRRDIS